MGKISEKIIEGYQREKLNNVINLSERQEWKKKLAEIGKELRRRNNTGSDPSHQIYSLSQNLLSYFAEEISIEDDFIEYYDKVEEMEGDYMPDYPPMSPLTGSYFTYSCFCDLQFGKDKETICTIFYDLCKAIQIEGEILNALKNLDKSYMGFYKHLGFEDNLIILREISTNKIFYCVCTSGYKGKKDEIWYVRIVPNLDNVYDYSVTLTTPYIILNYGEEDWKGFYKRQNSSGKEIEKKVLKHNKNSNYWHDYIMDGYVNFTPNCIFLTGIPDIKGSKPHELNEDYFDKF